MSVPLSVPFLGVSHSWRPSILVFSTPSKCKRNTHRERVMDSVTAIPFSPLFLRRMNSASLCHPLPMQPNLPVAAPRPFCHLPRYICFSPQQQTGEAQRVCYSNCTMAMGLEKTSPFAQGYTMQFNPFGWFCVVLHEVRGAQGHLPALLFGRQVCHKSHMGEKSWGSKWGAILFVCLPRDKAFSRHFCNVTSGDNGSSKVILPHIYPKYVRDRVTLLQHLKCHII